MTTVRATVYTTTKLGPKRSLTPEGFLLCMDVPLARTGMMVYGPEETPIKPAPGGEVVNIFRDAEDLFNSITLASANGKSITVDHPDEDVTPGNVKELEVGVCLSPRRGEGVVDDLMLGDLLIKTPEGIQAVQEEGIEEISLGYEADYEQTGDGVGRQSNIIINHIALVESGRCGPRCAIGDQKPNLTGEKTMPQAKKKVSQKVLDFLHRAYKAKDASELEALSQEATDSLGEGGEGGEGDTHVHVHMDGGPGEQRAEPTMDDEESSLQQFMAQNAAEHDEFRQRIAALEEALAARGGAGDSNDPDADPNGDPTGDEFPEEAKDELPEELQGTADKVKDSAPFRDSFQDTVAMAEILSPGVRIPTFDSAAKPKATFKDICGLRRTSLDTAYQTPETRQLLDTILGGRKLDTKRMTCDAVRTLFRSAASMKQAMNNAALYQPAGAPSGGNPGTGAPRTLADINRQNADYWKNH